MDGTSSQSYPVVGLGNNDVEFLVSVTILLAMYWDRGDTSTVLSLKLGNLTLFNCYIPLNERGRWSCMILIACNIKYITNYYYSLEKILSLKYRFCLGVC